MLRSRSTGKQNRSTRNCGSGTHVARCLPNHLCIAKNIQGDTSFRIVFAKWAVDDFVMVTPPKFTRFCYLSTRRCQVAHHKSLGIAQFHQISPRTGIWLGTRGSEVQILSPRPIFSMSVPETWVTERSGDIGYTFGPKGFSRGCKVFSSRSI